ncbi:MAG TPA: hypothetical protein VKU91_00410 [Acidimicrobiales bacterium]|nr:hypothetical protein [Acidimicrobiales bacterium]
MLTSISPLGERARRNRWATTVAFYLFASVGAATATGAALGGAGSVLPGGPAPRAAALAVVAAWAVAADAGVVRVPTVRRQVNEDWLNRYRGWVYGAGFGAQLGVGITTIVTTATVYATVAAEVLVGGPWAGALVGATFGLVRGLPILATAGVADHRALVARHRQVVAAAPVVSVLAVTVTALITAGLATAAALQLTGA